MRKFIIKIGIISLVSMAVLMACHDDDISGPNVKIETSDEGVTVVTNSSALANRIEVVNEPLDVDDFSGSSARAMSAPKKPAPPGYEWTFLAQMPALNGLSATFIEYTQREALIDGVRDYIYVSYNSQGSSFGGAFEVIDVTDPDAPFVVSQVLFDDVDINQFTIDPRSNKVWLAGSRNVDGAVIIELEAIDGVLSSPPYTFVSLKNVFDDGISASANSIRFAWDNPSINEEYILITCGNTIGGLVKLDATTLEYIEHLPFPSAKYVVTDRYPNPVVDLVTFSSGTDAKVRVHDIEDLSVERTISLGSISHQNVVQSEYGKNTMVLASAIATENRTVYIALGSSGVKAYKVNTGDLEHSSVSSMLSSGNSNGVSVDEDFEFIYMANGADGLAVAPIPKNNDDIVPIFTWDLPEAPASANYVASAHFETGKNDPDYSLIFVAKGLGGVKILKVEEEEK